MLSWRTHPLRRRPLAGVVACLVACACVVLVQLWARTPLLTVLAVAAFVVSLWPFYFPVRYRCDNDGIQIDYRVWKRRIAWTRFRSCVIMGDRVVLSPFSRGRALERFRVLVLPCPDNRDDVVSILPETLRQRPVSEPGKDAS